MVHLVILSPQWLSDCFSSIVSVKNSFCREGRLPMRALPQIWKSDQFPISLQSTLIHILERFEILFVVRKPNVPESDCEAIVPSLLPTSAPKGLDNAWGGCVSGEKLTTFGRKYSFSFITRAFFSRLLVRLLHTGVC